MNRKKRGIAVVTGACGGIGAACCRQLGKRYDLLLCDMAEERLGSFAALLKDEGYAVAAQMCGDLRDPTFTTAVLDEAMRAGSVDVVLHTAGFTAIDADWQGIISVNLIATEHLLRAVEPRLAAGSVTILIGSIAGHLVKAGEEVDRLLDDPLQDGLLDKFAPHMACLEKSLAPRNASSIAYALAKRATIRACEAKVVAWAKRGARIVSISPGAILTAMTRREIAAGVNAVDRVRDATPAGRWGTPMDIASAVDFLASPLASFVSGCDLRVDGGVIPALTGRNF